MRFNGRWIGVAVALALAATGLAVALPARADAPATLTILFDFGDGTYRWSAPTPVANPSAPNATWDATLAIAQALGVSVGWTWYSCCGAFIYDVGGRNPPAGTGLFAWNATAAAWDLAPVGLSSLTLPPGNTTLAISDSAFDSVTFDTRTPVPTPRDPFPSTQFRGDLRNDGAGMGGAPGTNVVAWDADLHLREIEATPAVGLGQVFVPTMDGIFALDRATGAVRWKDASLGGLSSPALVNGALLFGGVDGRLHALNATDGQELWNTSLVPHAVFSGITSSPKVLYDLAYVGTFNETGGDGEVAAVWISNGTVAWTHATASVDFSSPAVDGGRVFIGVMGRYNTSTAVTWEPPYGVLALDAATGAERWFFPTNDSVAASPAVWRGLVIAPSKDGEVYAINGTTGALAWKADVAAGVSSPALAGGRVIVGGGSFGGAGVVTALDAASGDTAWTFRPNGPVQASIAVANGTAYFGTNVANGTLYAVDAATGRLVWSFAPSASQPAPYFFSSPVVADGVLYAACDNGHVYAFAGAAPPASPGSSSAESTEILLGILAVVVVAAVVATVVVRRSKRHGP